MEDLHLKAVFLSMLGLESVFESNSKTKLKNSNKIHSNKLSKHQCRQIISICPFTLIASMPILRSSIDSYFELSENKKRILMSSKSEARFLVYISKKFIKIQSKNS
jgi:hypothetical protein